MAAILFSGIWFFSQLQSNRIRANSNSTVFPEPVGAHRTTGSSLCTAYKEPFISFTKTTVNKCTFTDLK